MKDIRQETLESARPNRPASHCINHALEALYNDEVKSLEDEVVSGLTYEELIGALLLAKDQSQNHSLCNIYID